MPASSPAAAKASSSTAKPSRKFCRNTRGSSRPSRAERRGSRGGEVANRSVRGIFGKFLVGQPHRIDHDLVRSNLRRRFESRRPARGHIIILIHTVAAHAKPADQHAISVKPHAPWKKNNATFVLIRRAGLESLCARIRHILCIQIEERTAGA